LDGLSAALEFLDLNFIDCELSNNFNRGFPSVAHRWCNEETAREDVTSEKPFIVDVPSNMSVFVLPHNDLLPLPVKGLDAPPIDGKSSSTANGISSASIWCEC
jgi:hypothetical protein